MDRIEAIFVAYAESFSQHLFQMDKLVGIYDYRRAYHSSIWGMKEQFLIRCRKPGVHKTCVYAVSLLSSWDYGHSDGAGFIVQK